MATRPLRKQVAEVAGEETPTEALDNQQTPAQSEKTGAIDHEGLVQSVARDLGWKPLAEWDRAPENWRDAPEFLKHTPQKVKALQESNRSLTERSKRNAQAAEAAIEEERRRTQLELQARIAAAAEAGDKDAAAQAAEQLTRTNVPAATAAWLSRNTWFNQDPEAQTLAKAVAERAARAGATTEEQLDAAEAQVRKRFPEHFEPAEPAEPPARAQPEPREEVRLSEARQRAAIPVVAAGSRGGNSAPKEKGFAEIPSGDQQLYNKHFKRRFEGRGMTTDQAQAAYAKTYWSNQA